MRTFTVDRLAQDRERDPNAGRGTLLYKSYYLNDTPRLMLACRLLGHRPVVDGTGQPGERGYLSRWVVCDRCGVRPDPQGSLDAERWNIGDRYDGPFDGELPADPRARWAMVKSLKDATFPPGPWPNQPTGALGAEVIIGRRHGLDASIEFKVGNGGSEHVLAAHCLTPLGGVFLHTEKHGQWLQRRLNPVGYESRVTGLRIGHWRFIWKLWAKRDSSHRDDPWWQEGSIRIDPRELLLGPSRYWHTVIGDPVERTITFPHGETHTVRLTLEHRESGREKRGRRRHDGYSVDWRCHGGIPDGRKPGDSGTWGSAVKISDRAARSEQWPDVAVAQLVAWVTEQRAAYGYTPPTESQAAGQ